MIKQIDPTNQSGKLQLLILDFDLSHACDCIDMLNTYALVDKYISQMIQKNILQIIFKVYQYLSKFTDDEINNKGIYSSSERFYISTHLYFTKLFNC